MVGGFSGFNRCSSSVQDSGKSDRCSDIGVSPAIGHHHHPVTTDQRPGPGHRTLHDTRLEAAPTCHCTVLQSCSLQSSLPCPADHHAAPWDVNNNPVMRMWTMRRETKLFGRKARWLSNTHQHWSIQKQLSFRLDNFDYDEISLGSEASSPHVEMALLSHTLQYLTGRINFIHILHNYKIQPACHE